MFDFNIDKIVLKNGIFDHFNIDSDTDLQYTTQIPYEYNITTLLNCNFNGNISAGNSDLSIDDIDKLVIKRRKSGEFDWITIHNVDIENLDNIRFVYRDYFAKNGQSYEYALVPSLNGVEGNYIINSVISEFKGNYISNKSNSYKLDSGVSFGEERQMSNTAEYLPIGNKYPVFISQANTNYRSGQFTAIPISSNDDLITQNRISNTEYLNSFVDFLNDKKPKIFKDWNGNIRLIRITSEIQISKLSEIQGGLSSVTFTWSEINDAETQQGLASAGFAENGV